MLRYFCKYFSLSLTCFFGACSIHPLPNDVTGVKTATIVRKIRCEAKEAILLAAYEILHRKHRHQEISNEDSLHKMDSRSLNRWESERLDDLVKIGIVYNFTLQGVETDGLMFNSDIIKPIKNGTETYSPSLGNSLKRDNTRTFTISDSFTKLLALSPNHCNFNSTGPNYEYPIAGRIGLDEMIQTFVRLSATGDVVPEDSSDASQKSSTTANDSSQTPPASATPKAPANASSDTLSPAGPPTMVDTIIFTTTISAGLTPKVTFSPAGTGVQLMDASLAGTVSRVDTHEVVIGLALGSSPANTGALSALLNAKTTALFFTHQAKDPGFSGEVLAAQAVTQEFIRHGHHRVDIAIVP